MTMKTIRSGGIGRNVRRRISIGGLVSHDHLSGGSMRRVDSRNVAARSRVEEARVWVQTWKDKQQAGDALTRLDVRTQARPTAREWIDAWTSKQKTIGDNAHADAQDSVEGEPKKEKESEGLALSMASTAGGVVGFLALDRGIAAVFKQAGIKFPAPLVGMFGLLGLLFTLERVAPSVSKKLESAAAPALKWLGRWLPLFYVPSLVVIPLVIRGIAPSHLAAIFGTICIGLVSSLLVTAQAAFVIRAAVKTQMQPVAPAPPMEPFTYGVKVGTLSVATVAYMVAAFSPVSSAAASAAGAAFMLAATVGGYIGGCQLPARVRTFLHPIISCALVANISAYALSITWGSGYLATLGSYLTKGAGPIGAGDILMSFLGSVILSFGFRIYGQRDIMKRHYLEVGGCVIISCIFSLLTTVIAGRLLGLPPLLSSAIAPRSITVALALPIGALLGAQEAASVTAAAVVLTGLLGAAVAQKVLDKFGFKDPIARGLATAGSAHGLGTAALAREEPEALPFCALAYALMGITGTVLVSFPPFRALLLAIAG